MPEFFLNGRALGNDQLTTFLFLKGIQCQDR